MDYRDDGTTADFAYADAQANAAATTSLSHVVYTILHEMLERDQFPNDPGTTAFYRGWRKRLEATGHLRK